MLQFKLTSRSNWPELVQIDQVQFKLTSFQFKLTGNGIIAVFFCFSIFFFLFRRVRVFCLFYSNKLWNVQHFYVKNVENNILASKKRLHLVLLTFYYSFASIFLVSLFILETKWLEAWWQIPSELSRSSHKVQYFKSLEDEDCCRSCLADRFDLLSSR
jgi:hypothetical protein